MVCRSSVSACSPYIPNASEPITLFSQRVLCGAQHFQRHLWEFVAFVGLNCSTSGLTTTFGYSPLGVVLPCFSTSPAHASCSNLYALTASTPPPLPLLLDPSIISAISRLHLLYAVRHNLLIPAITFQLSTSSFRTFVEGGAAVRIHDRNGLPCHLLTPLLHSR